MLLANKVGTEPMHNRRGRPRMQASDIARASRDQIVRPAELDWQLNPVDVQSAEGDGTPPNRPPNTHIHMHMHIPTTVSIVDMNRNSPGTPAQMGKPCKDKGSLAFRTESLAYSLPWCYTLGYTRNNLHICGRKPDSLPSPWYYMSFHPTGPATFHRIHCIRNIAKIPDPRRAPRIHECNSMLPNLVTSYFSGAAPGSWQWRNLQTFSTSLSM